MIKNHFDQNKINEYDLEEIIEHGEFLFKVSFNELDGLGRPETSGTTKTRPRRESPQNFNRISGPMQMHALLVTISQELEGVVIIQIMFLD